MFTSCHLKTDSSSYISLQQLYFSVSTSLFICGDACFFFFLHARHLADIHAHECLATSVTRTVKTAGKTKCKEGQGSDIVVTVSLTYFSCESQRILWSGERPAAGFFFFFFSFFVDFATSKHRLVGEEDSTPGSKVHSNTDCVCASLCPTVWNSHRKFIKRTAALSGCKKKKWFRACS